MNREATFPILPQPELRLLTPIHPGPDAFLDHFVDQVVEYVDCYLESARRLPGRVA